MGALDPLAAASPSGDRLLTLQEAAARFGLSVSTLRTAVQARELAHARLGSPTRGRIWLTEAGVREWIDSKTSRPPARHLDAPPVPAVTLEQLMPRQRRFS